MMKRDSDAPQKETMSRRFVIFDCIAVITLTVLPMLYGAKASGDDDQD